MGLTMNSGAILTVQLFFDNVNTQSALNVLHYQVGALTCTPPPWVSAGSSIAQKIYNHFKDEWAAAASIVA